MALVDDGFIVSAESLTLKVETNRVGNGTVTRQLKRGDRLPRGVSDMDIQRSLDKGLIEKTED